MKQIFLLETDDLRKLQNGERMSIEVLGGNTIELQGERNGHAHTNGHANGNGNGHVNWADRVLQLRRGLGLSQRALSERLSVHLSSIQRWERGVKPGSQYITKLEKLENRSMAAPTPITSSVVVSRGPQSAAARARMAKLMKRRWAAARKAGLTTLKARKRS